MKAVEVICIKKSVQKPKKVHMEEGGYSQAMNIRQIVKKNFGMIVVLSLVALVSSVTRIASPYLLQRIIENFENFTYYLICFLALILISYAGQFLFEYLIKRFAITFQTAENVKLAKLVYLMKYSDIEKYEPTYLINRQSNAVGYIFKLISTNLSDISGGLISIVVIIVLMTKYNFMLALCYTTYAIISFVGYKFLNKILMKKSMKVQKIVSSNFKNILSFMTNINFIKMLAKFKILSKHIEKLFKSTAEENANINFFAAGISIILDFVLEIMQSVIYIITFYLAFTGKIQFAQVATIVLLNSIFRNSMKTLNTTNIGLRDVRASLKFINDEILNNQEHDNGNIILSDISSIQINAKDIGYNDTVYIKAGTLEAKRGEIVGIVGSSGIGKSTLIKVLLGLKNDTPSSILYNGNYIQNIAKSSIKEHTSYISQTKSVFPITLRENLLLGMDDDKVQSQATQFSIDELLQEEWFKKFANLEQGLDTIILEGATNLSGGDQQKISIGRILLNPPDLLILDEFSNSIDKNAEQQIMSRIKEKFNDRIILLITHDEDLLKWCNKIYAIENRFIVQQQ